MSAARLGSLVLRAARYLRFPRAASAFRRSPIFHRET